ncbi:MAG: GAF domain-containing protein [Pseudomonadota bacterium]
MPESPDRRLSLPQFKAISYAISNYEELNVLINHFVEGLCRAFKFKGASIMLYDDREKQLFHVGSYGVSEAYLNKGPIFCDEKQAVFSKKEAIFIDDLHQDPRVQYPKEAIEEGISSMVTFPIQCREATIGIIRIYHSEPIRFHADDIDSIRVLGHLLGLVTENQGLKNFLDMVKGAMGSLPLRMLKGLP